MNNIVANIFNELPKFPQSKEIIDILVESNNIRIEKIVSTGQSSPDVFWYEQEENEFVLLLNGTAELEFEDKTIKMKAGDYLLIPSKQKHRVKSTSRTEHSVWLTVFYI